MRENIDYEWGWSQIQRMVDNAYGASSNISNIVSHMANRSFDQEGCCGEERPIRKTLCQLPAGHKGSCRAVVFWEKEQCDEENVEKNS